jgi:hypothetical protein
MVIGALANACMTKLETTTRGLMHPRTICFENESNLDVYPAIVNKEKRRSAHLLPSLQHDLILIALTFPITFGRGMN